MLMLANQVGMRSHGIYAITNLQNGCVKTFTFHGIQTDPDSNAKLKKNTKMQNSFSCFFFLRFAALTVRYLTRRFIGEYRSKTDLLYRQTVSLDSGLLDVEIVDVSHESDNDFPLEQFQWADACLIVYSITDRESFQYATRTLTNMKSLQNNPFAYLIANKSDLDHLREVSLTFVHITNWFIWNGSLAPREHAISIKTVSLATTVVVVSSQECSQLFLDQSELKANRSGANWQCRLF